MLKSVSSFSNVTNNACHQPKKDKSAYFIADNYLFKPATDRANAVMLSSSSPAMSSAGTPVSLETFPRSSRTASGCLRASAAASSSLMRLPCSSSFLALSAAAALMSS